MSENGSNPDWDGAIDELLDRTDPDEELPEGARERMWESISTSLDEGIETGENGSETDGGNGDGAAAGPADGAGGTAASTAEAGGFASWLGGSGIAKTVATFLIGASAGAGGYAVLDTALEGGRTTRRAVSTADAGDASDAGRDAGRDGTAVDTADGDTGFAETGALDAGDAVADTGREQESGSESTPAPASDRSIGEEPNERPEGEAAGSPEVSDESGAEGGDAGAGLSGERLILSRAQAALGRGRPEEALDALEEHAGEYPEGRLAEERTALEVRVLDAAGRTAEAKRRAREFLEEHPQSIFQGQMRRILRRASDAGD